MLRLTMSPGVSDNPRTARLSAVLEDIVARRCAGEDLDDEVVKSAWPELLPELAERLADLRQVELARDSAGHAAARGVIDTAPGKIPEGHPIPFLPEGYAVLRTLRRGGQGVVYEALQKSTGRRVALKVVLDAAHPGSNEAARFKREVQVLASLHDPGIVTILDSGVVTGARYLVMDFIDGAPLDDFVRRHALAPRQTLALFLKVCRAVTAAHRCGVIHRDLKPSNILVDRTGEPRVLDFGLAKITEFADSADEPAAAMTCTGQFVGSLPWASPEQAEGHAERVDVRSDVFSLGVILFQLLTGTLPHTTAGSLRAVLERIGRDPVPRPSSRHAGLDGEIDTLVLTCLAKEPERRYQTVNELAADIENYLAHRPIASKRDSYWYVVRKAVARRRLPVAIGSAFLLVIVGGLAASLVFWRQAAYQRDRAAHAEAVAQEEARRAHASAQRSQTTCDFLRETLATVDPMRIGREVRVADLLADAASRLDAAFPGDSVERADLEDALGRAYQALGLYDEAEPHRARALEVRRRVLGDEHPDTLSALEAVGELHELQRQGEVLPFVQTAFEARRRLLGPDDPDTLHSMNYLAFLYRRAGNSPRAEELQLEALSRLRRVRGENDRETLNCLANLAWLRESQGRLDDSATLFQEALDGECAALGEADPDTMDVRDHYGRILRELGRLEECEATFRHNLYLRRSVHGPEHPETLAAASNLAVALHIRGELAEAEALQRSVIAARKRVERPNFPDILFSLVSLTQILIDSGRPGEAIDVAQEAVTLSANLENPDPRHRANALRALGAALLAAGDAAAAEPWLCEAWDFWRGASVNDRRRTLAESDYGACLTALGRFADAEPLLVETNRAIQADPGVSELTRERSRERLRKMMCAPARSAGLEHDVQSDVESAQHGL